MRKENLKSAFTLIEMMIVVAIIGIMIGGVFRLISAAGDNASRAATIKRLEKLQNALSGYYAVYGSYPPVERVRSGDPFVKDDATGINDPSESSELNAGNARNACAAQPVAFDFPNRKQDDVFVREVIKLNNWKAKTSYSQFQVKTTPREKRGWRMFQFGLLSFLLPRVAIMGGKEAENQNNYNNVFRSTQWSANNQGDLEAVRTREKVCANWIENFRGELDGGMTLYGVNTCRPHSSALIVTAPRSMGDSDRYCLLRISISDEWGNPIYYYSAPPYQSYRVWSAGPNGCTFPPWIKVNALSSGDQKKVADWTKDDITRFDR